MPRRHACRHARRRQASEREKPYKPLGRVQVCGARQGAATQQSGRGGAFGGPLRAPHPRSDCATDLHACLRGALLRTLPTPLAPRSQTSFRFTCQSANPPSIFWCSHNGAATNTGTQRSGGGGGRDGRAGGPVVCSLGLRCLSAYRCWCCEATAAAAARSSTLQPPWPSRTSRALSWSASAQRCGVSRRVHRTRRARMRRGGRVERGRARSGQRDCPPPCKLLLLPRAHARSERPWEAGRPCSPGPRGAFVRGRRRPRRLSTLRREK
eukprot:362727-Chlamydomonas_euryale.AAC.3